MDTEAGCKHCLFAVLNTGHRTTRHTNHASSALLKLYADAQLGAGGSKAFLVWRYLLHVKTLEQRFVPVDARFESAIMQREKMSQVTSLPLLA
jgi:hypothetical protein